jgi:multidrug efflux pump
LLAVPVSLIGTLAVMQGLGFSLNNLSLFGLVLAIGIVVDDAIVVVENIERNIAEGLAPKAAAHKAMDEVSGAVVAVALVLCAVFIPTAFISGITGQFYKQFALTIAVSTLISAFNSLTLSPALGALLIRPHHQRDDLMTRGLNAVLGWFFRLFNRSFDWGSQAYARLVRRLVRVSVLVLVVYAGLAALGGWLFRKVPVGFIPPQDMGYMIAVVQLPDASSFERTDAVVRRVDDIARRTPGIAHTFALSGYSSVLQASQSNLGAAFFILDDFENRKSPELQADRIMAQLRREYASIQEARIIVLPPPALRGLGNAGGFRIQVQDLNNAGLPALEAATQKLLAAAQKDPQFTSLITGFRANSPQYHIDLDRAQAKTMGVSLADINEALQVYLGGSYVNDFNLFGRTYQVTAQADPLFRTDPSDLSRIKVRNQAGDMVPLSAVTTSLKRGGADRVQRYNLYYSADISGSTVPGVSSGQMIDRVTQLARETLPAGFDFAWTDLTYQQILAGNSISYIFPLCVLFVFLVLAALYESWSLPLAIILIVPMCLLSAIGGVWALGRDNNIFTQIGLVVLVGLAAKNAILIVEFAKQKQDAGMNRLDAAVEACRLRLRPILMTSFAFILGVLPLVLARGAGAEMRQALGTAVFFGMLGVTLFGLLFTPVFYVAIRRWVERKRQPATPSENLLSKRHNASPRG